VQQSYTRNLVRVFSLLFYKIAPVLSLLRNMGEKYGGTPAQVALNWLVAQGNVIPIAGVKNAEQVKQNVGAFGWKFTDDGLGKLDKITHP
jgi:aryl-alcohol dehydrogenase-like predicted oxidoreductase